MSAPSEEQNVISENMKTLLNENPELELMKEQRKVKCSLTGHMMPLREDVIQSHITGRRFQALRHKTSFNYSQYEPHLVPSFKTGHRHLLFCCLTLRHINKLPSHVEKHVNGRRYQRALARWKQCQKTKDEFQPYRKQKGQNPSMDGEKDSGDSASEEDETLGAEDNMSDLYPDEGSSSDDQAARMDDDEEETIVESSSQIIKSGKTKMKTQSDSASIKKKKVLQKKRKQKS